MKSHPSRSFRGRRWVKTLYIKYLFQDMMNVFHFILETNIRLISLVRSLLLVTRCRCHFLICTVRSLKQLEVSRTEVREHSNSLSPAAEGECCCF